MASANKTSAFTFGGVLSSSNNSGAIEFDDQYLYEVELPAMDAQNVGTLTTRTDDDTGVATLTTGHSITTGMVVDVYWSGGVRFGMDATVSGNDVTIDGGDGDNLPAQSTAITGVYEQVEKDPLYIDGDLVEFVAVIYRNTADQTAKAHINLKDAAGDKIAEHDLVHDQANGGHAFVSDIAGGDTNLYTGDPITKGYGSHNSTSAAVIYVAVGRDS